MQILAVEPPAGEKVEGLRNLDDGYIPPIYEKWGGPDLLDGKRDRAGPGSRSSGPAGWSPSAACSPGISAGAALAGARQGGRADRRAA